MLDTGSCWLWPVERKSTTNLLKTKSFPFFPVIFKKLISRAITFTLNRQPLGQLKFSKTDQMHSGSDFRERSVIPIGFEPMTYSNEIYFFIRQNNRKNSDLLLKYTKWATDKATFRRSCLKLQITNESGQMPAFCFYKLKGYDQNQLLPVTF